MQKRSAGLVMYRRHNSSIEVFLVHPGGPFWAKKDLGAWSIPKGEYLDGEEPLVVAQREFQEETGFAAHGEPSALPPPSRVLPSRWYSASLLLGSKESTCDIPPLR